MNTFLASKKLHFLSSKQSTYKMQKQINKYVLNTIQKFTL